MFPKRFKNVSPEDYPDLVLPLHVNPTGDEYDALLTGHGSDPAAASALGAALVGAYQGARVEAYGAVFDFTTPEAAMATLLSPAIPEDLRYWLRNAPWEVVGVGRADLGKSLASSIKTGASSTPSQP